MELRMHRPHAQFPQGCASLCACIWLAALTTAAYPATLPPIQTQSGWVTFKNIEVRDDFKIFRRYGYIDNPQYGYPRNFIMFNCSKGASKAASHLTFVLPKEFQPDSFPRTTWLPKIGVRFLIDNQLSVSMPGEYRDGELYFDLDTDTMGNFEKLMAADTLAVGFGDKNDVVQFQFTEQFDELFSAFIKDTGSKLGEMTHYSRTGTGGVDESCKAYQQSGPQKPMGPEGALIAIFSTVVALEVDCSFKSNRSELQRLAHLHGFALEEFQAEGRFFNQMEHQTHAMRGFIKDKGCKAVRGIVKRSFENVGR
jgi:hypothetical protein